MGSRTPPKSFCNLCLGPSSSRHSRGGTERRKGADCLQQRKVEDQGETGMEKIRALGAMNAENCYRVSSSREMRRQ